MKDGVVNAEVVSTDTEGILREAREVACWHPNIVVKVPMIPDGVRALIDPVQRRHPRERDAGVFGAAGASGGQGRARTSSARFWGGSTTSGRTA